MPKTPDQTPTIRSLNGRNTNKDARAAFNMTALFLAELPSGGFALCDRSQNFYLETNEPPTREEFRLFSRLLSQSRTAAQGTYLGEPSDKDLATDLRRERQPPRRQSPATLDLEIDL